ncbi:unnamed protein product [Lactuca virosa]|uniref:Uncharacterized protein n=1 Tax=Lactuca virosa TaxID=75947 RepID=A0AAU9PAU0_9ASTR|nr:unnamed protein product [Lactuca virosa]
MPRTKPEVEWSWNGVDYGPMKHTNPVSSSTTTTRRGPGRGNNFLAQLCFVLIPFMHMVSSCVLFGYFAEMASRARRHQPGSRPDFSWYSFPRTVGPEIHAR